MMIKVEDGIPDGAVEWVWLATCRVCGVPHHWVPRGIHHNGDGSWTAPDGHFYEPRLSIYIIEQLMNEYLESKAVTTNE